MNKLISRIALLVLASAFVSVGLNSCKKKQQTIAKIRVIDTSGATFTNAMVRLWADPTIPIHGAVVIDDTVYTNADGVATFDYTDDFNLGQAGFAVLNIEVRSGESLYGEGIIKIEPEETTQENVVIQ